MACAEIHSDCLNALQMRIRQTGVVVEILYGCFGCTLRGSLFVCVAQCSPCKKDSPSTSIRQIFNGREQNDLYDLSCAQETRSDGRPKGVPYGTRHRRMAYRNKMPFQARQRYFVPWRLFFCILFSDKPEKSMPPEARPCCAKKNGRTANIKRLSAEAESLLLVMK